MIDVYYTYSSSRSKPWKSSFLERTLHICPTVLYKWKKSLPFLSLTIICWSNDIPGHDSLGQEPEFRIKNSRVLWFHLDVIYVSLKKQVAWKINSCNAKKTKWRSTLVVSYCHHLICPWDGTVIYYMHTFFVVAEVANTNKIFLMLLHKFLPCLLKPCTFFFSNKEISKMK